MLNISAVNTNPFNNTFTAIDTHNTKTKDVALQTLQSSDGTTNHLLTKGNIERAGWASLAIASASSSVASYLFYGTIAAAAGATTAALLPASLALAAGAFTWSAYTTPDYDNTAEVAKYREEAKSLSLEETIRKHGKWTFDRKILSPEQVETKYLEKVSSLRGLPAILTYHTEMEKALKSSDNAASYSLPDPTRFKEIIQKECKHLTFKEIKDLHSLTLLFSWNLLDSASFTKKYQEHVEDLFYSNNILSVISDYELTLQALKASGKFNMYEVPHPSELKGKWQQQNYSLKDTLKLGLNTLISYGIFTNDSFINQLKKLEKDFNENEKSLLVSKTAIEEIYSQDISRAKTRYNNQMQAVDMAADSLYSAKLIRNARISFLEGQISVALHSNDWTTYHSLVNELEYAKTDNFLYSLVSMPTHYRIQQMRDNAKKEYDADVKMAQEKRKNSLEPIHNMYEKNTSELERQFSRVKSLFYV